MAVVWLPVGAKYVPLHKTSRSAQRPAHTPIQLVPTVLSPWMKLSIRDADHSPSFSAKFQNACSYTSNPWYAFIVRTVTTCNFYFGVALDTEIWSHVFKKGREISSLSSGTWQHVGSYRFRWLLCNAGTLLPEHRLHRKVTGVTTSDHTWLRNMGPLVSTSCPRVSTFVVSWRLFRKLA